MTLDPGHLDHARKVADAVLYEGYLLYPYRQSSQKNQVRFQFGVLMPPAWAAAGDSERPDCQLECLAECGDGASVEILVRYLQLQRRAGETGGSPWDEAAECEQWLSVPVAQLLGPGVRQQFRSPSGESAEDRAEEPGGPLSRVIRRWPQLDGLIAARAERVAGPYGALRLQVRVENRTEALPAPRTRQDALQHALISAHVLIGIPGGSFLSMTDPPEWAAAEVAACASSGIWPVLAGPPECRNLMLATPVILADHPEIAPESAGDLFDATEIDEILTLRTLALTDEEKREARATDPRAAALLDRVEGLPPEMLERMHGAIRYLGGTAGPAGPPGGVPGTAAGSADGRVPWWDPGADTSVSPETDHVVIGGIRVARGSRVRMRPGARRADAQDLFLAGRDALVEAVLFDVDGQVHVAVSPVLDPVADLQRSHGRFLYFAPDEIEPIVTGPAETGPGHGSDVRSPRHQEEQK